MLVGRERVPRRNPWRPRAGDGARREQAGGELPQVKETDWVRTPIDRFILATLEAKGLQATPPASAYRIIRRVSFDLAGLPPDPAEVEQFLAATWLLGVYNMRLSRRFRDRVTIALESHVATLQASIVTIAHQERPEHLDRLAMLRNQVFALDHMFMSLFSTLGWLFRLVVTALLLASVHPALVLLMVFAAPAFLVSTWRPAVERQVEESVIANARLGRHLFTLHRFAGERGRQPRAADELVIESNRA